MDWCFVFVYVVVASIVYNIRSDYEIVSFGIILLGLITMQAKYWI